MENSQSALTVNKYQIILYFDNGEGFFLASNE